MGVVAHSVTDAFVLVHDEDGTYTDTRMEDSLLTQIITHELGHYVSGPYHTPPVCNDAAPVVAMMAPFAGDQLVNGMVVRSRCDVMFEFPVGGGNRLTAVDVAKFNRHYELRAPRRAGSTILSSPSPGRVQITFHARHIVNEAYILVETKGETGDWREVEKLYPPETQDQLIFSKVYTISESGKRYYRVSPKSQANLTATVSLEDWVNVEQRPTITPPIQTHTTIRLTEQSTQFVWPGPVMRAGTAVGSAPIVVIWWWDAANEVWLGYFPGSPIPGLSTLTHLRTGYTYWAVAERSYSWVVPLAGLRGADDSSQPGSGVQKGWTATIACSGGDFSPIRVGPTATEAEVITAANALINHEHGCDGQGTYTVSRPSG